MRQVFINGRGEIVVKDVDPPSVTDESVLCRTAYSLVSTGTETMSVQGRRKHPNPLASDTAFGYTNSGTVEEVGSNVTGISLGDRVGNYGSPSCFGGHAEICRIGKHLCVKLPENVSLREAAFTGLGGIAMQAVRRAGLTFGEHVVVMGLGVLGQVIARICHAAAFQVIATDFLENRLRLARDAGITAVGASNGSVEFVKDATDGNGADAVIIVVASDSAEPITQALDMIRFGGRVVMVGVTKMEVDRTRMFAKEADFVISRAAGPGRYDPSYEGQGMDYPYPYVRWTEGRNLREFIRLVSEKRVRVDDLISHEFPVEQAALAFEQILDHPQETLGVLLKY